ncbi:VOC family protein [Marinicrinis sediminis]|uniref:VOC family protein n=1 Tax=Marinicrinis sediminis TaxID=1652465 RepID=A0ABW5RE55_9BACL
MNPVHNEIGAVFIPVREIEKARDWYSDILNLPIDGEILFGHLYVLPMEGTKIVLDSKISHDDHVYRFPPFHFNASDISEAFAYMSTKQVEMDDEINGNWFRFKDPDGNVLMVCECM